MATYTKESLSKLYKKDIIPIALSLQNKLEKANDTKTEALDEFLKLSDKITQLQSDVCITKDISNLLSSRLVDIKRCCWPNFQHSRIECLDIVDKSSEAKDKKFDESVVGIFNKLACRIYSNRVEAWH